MRDMQQGKKYFILVLILLYIPFLYNYGVRQAQQESVDFPSFYWAANLSFNSQKSPYGVGVFDEAEKQLDQHIFPYLYPPPSLLLFLPFSFISYKTGKIAMLIVNHIGVIVVAYIILFGIIRLERLRQSGMLELLFLILYILFFYPIVKTLDHGQINLLVLIFLCLFWYALKREGTAVLIALPLTAAILLKTYPLIFMLLLIFKRKYSVISWTLGLLCLFSIFSYLVLPHPLWTDWFSKTLSLGGYGSKTSLELFSGADAGIIWNQSINGFTARLFLENNFTSTLLPNSLAAIIVPYILSFCVILITGIISYLTSISHKNRHLDFEVSIFLFAMYLVAPLSWEHHLVFVLPAILIAIQNILFSREDKALQVLVALSAFLIAWRLPFTSMILRNGILTLGMSIKLYAVATLWIILVVKLNQLLKHEKLNLGNIPNLLISVRMRNTN